MKKTIKLFGLFLIMLFGFVLVGCAIPETLQDAADYVSGMYNDTKITNGDYELVSQVYVGDEKFDVSWEMSVVSGKAEEITLTPGGGTTRTKVTFGWVITEELAYDLTATIKNSKGDTTSVTLPRRTANVVEVSTWQTYSTASKGAALIVEGVITATYISGTKASLYLVDTTEAFAGLGYYVYNMEVTDEQKAELTVGKKISVKGSKDLYSGTWEVVNGTYKILDNTPVAVTPVDLTDEYKAAASTSHESLARYQGGYVTLRGVDMIDITDKYLNFELAGKKSYVYISSSSCMVDADGQAALKKKVQKGAGATVTGIVAQYNGAIHLLPTNVDSITLTDGSLTDAERVAAAKGKVLKLNNTEVSETLINSWKEATITWVSKNTAVINNDGEILYPEVDTTVELTATITKGTVNDTATISVKVKAVVLNTIAEVLKVENNTIVRVKGTVMASSSRGYVLRDETGMAYVYAHNGDKVIPAVGKYVEVVGTRGFYNGDQVVPLKTTEITTGKDYTHPDATVMDSSSTAAYVAKNKDYPVTYASINAKVSVDGNYINLIFEDTTDVQGSVSYPATALANEIKALDGQTVTVYGYVFGHSSNKYLNVIVTEVVEKEYTDAEKMEEAKKLADAVASDDVVANITLPTGFQGATIAWSSNNTAVVANDGKVTLPTDEDVVVELSYTITLEGQTTVTGKVSVTVKKLEVLKINKVLEAVDAADGTVVCFIGKVVGTDKYGNVYVADETGVILLAGSSSYAACEMNAVVKVVGKTQAYLSNGAYYARRIMSKASVTASTETVNPAAALTNLTATQLAALNTADGKLDKAKVTAATFNNRLVSITGKLVTKQVGTNTNYFIVDSANATLVHIYYNDFLNGEYELDSYLGLEVTVTGAMYGYYVTANAWSVSGFEISTAAQTPEGATIAWDPGFTGRDVHKENDADNGVVGTLTAPVVNGTTITFGGEGQSVAYYLANETLGRTAGNRVGVAANVPTGAVANEIKLWWGGKEYSNVTLDNNNTQIWLYQLIEEMPASGDYSSKFVVRWSNASAPVLYTIVVKAGTTLVAAPGPAATVLVDVNFKDLANKTLSTTWLATEAFAGWSQVGNMGQSYAGYAGFGRGVDDYKPSSLVTPTITVTKEMTATLSVKGNGTDDISYFTLTALDANGNVVATAKVVSDDASVSTVGSTQGKLKNNNDSVVVMQIGDDCFEDGKSYSDVVKLSITYFKTGGNMGLKSFKVTE